MGYVALFIMKVVELSNGKYAVQVRRFPIRIFIDMANPIHRWSRYDRFFEDCQCTKEEAINYVKNRDCKVVRYHNAT